MTAVALAATPSRARTWWLLPALAALVAAAGVWWSLSPYLVGVFHDDGVYALLARSIASGQGFHYSHLPGMPAATHYPPLYPLVLAALWHFAPDFPTNVGVLLGLNAVLAGAAAAGWCVFATRRLAWPAGIAAVVAIVIAMSTPMLTLSGALLSEMLFVALLWPALLAAESALDAHAARLAASAGAIVGAPMLVRTHAITLLVALLVLFVMRRHFRAAGITLGVALAVQLPWLVWTHFAAPRVVAPLEGSYGSYLGWFTTGLRDGGLPFLLDTARTNIGELGLLLRDRFSTGIAPLDALTVAIALAGIVAGAVSFARRAPVTLLFVASYFAIVVVWPYAPWRFAWGVWPLVAMLLVEGARYAGNRGPAWRTAAVVAMMLPALGFLRTELHSYATRAWRLPARQATAQLLPVLDWARANTGPRDVLLAEGEQVIALYTGRQAAPPVAFTALEYVRRRDEHTAEMLGDMLHAVPATQLVTMSPDVQRAALAWRDASISLDQVAAPRGLVAFRVAR